MPPALASAAATAGDSLVFTTSVVPILAASQRSGEGEEDGDEASAVRGSPAPERSSPPDRTAEATGDPGDTAHVVLASSVVRARGAESS